MITLRLQFKKADIFTKAITDQINAPGALIKRRAISFANRHYVPYSGIMNSKYARRCVLKHNSACGIPT